MSTLLLPPTELHYLYDRETDFHVYCNGASFKVHSHLDPVVNALQYAHQCCSS